MDNRPVRPIPVNFSIFAPSTLTPNEETLRARGYQGEVWRIYPRRTHIKSDFKLFYHMYLKHRRKLEAKS